MPRMKQTGEWANGVHDETDWGEIEHRMIQTRGRFCTGLYRLGRDFAQDDTDWGEIVRRMIKTGGKLCPG